MRPAATFNIGTGWNNQRPSFGMDALSLIFALGLHLPLLFMKFDVHKKPIDRPGERLVSVELKEPEKPKPIEAMPALPPPAPKKESLMSKLKNLVQKKPPPPPPPAPKPVPEKLVEAPKPLALQPKLDLPKVPPPLESKTNFKTTADAKLVLQQKKLADMPVPSMAPLSAKKLGINDNRAAVKNTKGSFQVAQNESLKSIGGGPSLIADTPAIAIRTSKTGTKENFSAPITQKNDKGRIGAVPTGSLNTGGPALGLRDSMIARDAAPAQISSRSPGGVPGGIPGGTGSKRDAGRFQTSAASPSGSLNGVGTAAPLSGNATTISRKREKPSMFSITGDLKDRKILKQVTPEYPAWAQEQGISASVVLEFTVDPSGAVKMGIVVRRTSGYPKLDETAILALRQWKFVPLPEGINRDEVGMITFNYSLN